MRIPRIYLSDHLAIGSSVTLTKPVFHHIVRVLRLKVGAPIALFNGTGGEYSAVLQHIARHTATVRITAFTPREIESSLKIVLAQGISRGDRMHFSVQKAVELGVDTILPLLTQRSVANLPQDRLHKRLQHWRSIVISACEQCGRNSIPVIQTPRTFDTWLHDHQHVGLSLMLAPRATESLSSLSAPASDNKVTLLIGPEGGLTDDEIIRAQAVGFNTIRLGPRTMRTETVGLAALAALQTLWGDLA